MSNWTAQDAFPICALVEKIAPACGCHVALTGGVLYKDGPRKDLDLLFYRIRQVEEINMTLLWKLLEDVCGIKKISGFGWCYKAKYADGRSIDCFFPEELTGEYIAPDDEPEPLALSTIKPVFYHDSKH